MNFSGGHGLGSHDFGATDHILAQQGTGSGRRQTGGGEYNNYGSAKCHVFHGAHPSLEGKTRLFQSVEDVTRHNKLCSVGAEIPRFALPLLIHGKIVAPRQPGG
jgi:hypothetical protein